MRTAVFMKVCFFCSASSSFILKMKGVAVLGGEKKKREEKQHNEKEEHTHMEKNGQRQSRLIANAVQMLSMTKTNY